MPASATIIAASFSINLMKEETESNQPTMQNQIRLLNQILKITFSFLLSGVNI